MHKSPEKIYTPYQLSHFDYSYPESLVALYPLKKRDESKLLVYNKGEIIHRKFYDLPQLLTSDDLLFFNNSKVVPARIFCERQSGAKVEVFLLQPVKGMFNHILQDTSGNIEFKSLIGNKKRVKNGERLIVHSSKNIFIDIIDKEEGKIQLIWQDATLSLSDVLTQIALIPLPPYIKRQIEKSDAETYQTIYGKNPGSVASTTAGLHFTENVFQALKNKKITCEYLTLHVGAGTFLPVKTENILQHDMHYETFTVSQNLLQKLLDIDKNIVAVGTTTLRALESIYWLGYHLLKTGKLCRQISKTFVWENQGASEDFSVVAEALLKYMQKEDIQEFTAQTGIMIIPGYRFRIVKKLITNFHQPKSTLIMLVAAFTGENWHKIYQNAIEHRYRLFSYGDSSLLIP